MVVVALFVILHNAALRRDLYTQLLVYTFQVHGEFESVAWTADVSMIGDDVSVL